MVDVQVVGPEVERSGEVLTPEALQFVGTLQHLFGASRDELLAARARGGRRSPTASRWTSWPRPPTCAPVTGRCPRRPPG